MQPLTASISYLEQLSCLERRTLGVQIPPKAAIFLQKYCLGICVVLCCLSGVSVVLDVMCSVFVTVCVQVQFQVGLAADGSGMRAVNIVSKHAFLRGYVESIKGQGQVCSQALPSARA